jgi:hypothetical protein
VRRTWNLVENRVSCMIFGVVAKHSREPEINIQKLTVKSTNGLSLPAQTALVEEPVCRIAGRCFCYLPPRSTYHHPGSPHIKRFEQLQARLLDRREGHLVWLSLHHPAPDPPAVRQHILPDSAISVCDGLCHRHESCRGLLAGGDGGSRLDIADG